MKLKCASVMCTKSERKLPESSSIYLKQLTWRISESLVGHLC